MEVVCVDVETDGPYPEVHEPVEIAWWDVTNGTNGTFIPPHTLTRSDQRALSVNHYWERGLYHQANWDDGTELRRFHQSIQGRLVVGSNPGFDWAFLRQLFVRECLPLDPLSYPPLDVATYAAGILHRDISERLGLNRLCRVLGVEPGDHTATGDVRACVECLLALRELR